MDNYRTHKHPTVNEWLEAHPRFHLHFTPTSSSWLNLVERYFAEITRKRIRRGTFRKFVPGGLRQLREAQGVTIHDRQRNHRMAQGSRYPKG